MKAIRIHAHGGPEVMRWEDVDLPAPAPGEARLRHTAIAVNFSDINQRRGGFYTAEPVPMPMIPGNEAAAVVENVGPGVTEVKPGDRVAYVGVHAVLDGVGRDTFMPSLDCLRPFGIIVNYGNASGHVPPLDLLDLAKRGGLCVSRPGLSHYLKEPGALGAAATELFALVTDGTLKIEIGRTHPLRDAAEAHRDVESRSLAGATVLIP